MAKLPDIAAGVNDGFHAPVRPILADGISDGILVELDVDIVAGSLFPLFGSGMARPVRSA